MNKITIFISISIISFTLIMGNEIKNIRNILSLKQNQGHSCENWNKEKDKLLKILIANLKNKKFRLEYYAFLNGSPCRYFDTFFILIEVEDIEIKKIALDIFEIGLKRIKQTKDWKLKSNAHTARFYAIIEYAKLKQFKKASYHKTIGEKKEAEDILIAGSRPAVDKEMLDIYKSVQYTKFVRSKKRFVYSNDINKAVLQAAENNDDNKVRYYIEMGADINASYFSGLNLFMISNSSDLVFIKYLKNKGANIYQIDSMGRNALMFAAQNANINKIKFLLANKLNVNYRDSSGRTAIYYAVFSYDIKVVKLLYSKGAKINIKDKFGQSPLDIAKLNKTKKIIKFFQIKLKKH